MHTLYFNYIAQLRDGMPSSPILVSDFKRDDYDTTYTESLGYFQSIVAVGGLCAPMLVMPST